VSGLRADDGLITHAGVALLSLLCLLLTGDVRRALEMLRRGVEIARQQHLTAAAVAAKTAASSNQQQQQQLQWEPGQPGLVRRMHVQQAQQEMFRGGPPAAAEEQEHLGEGGAGGSGGGGARHWQERGADTGGGAAARSPVALCRYQCRPVAREALATAQERWPPTSFNPSITHRNRPLQHFSCCRHAMRAMHSLTPHVPLLFSLLLCSGCAECCRARSQQHQPAG